MNILHMPYIVCMLSDFLDSLEASSLSAIVSALRLVCLQILFFTGGIYQVADYALFWTFQDGSLNEAKMGPPLLITIDSI